MFDNAPETVVAEADVTPNTKSKKSGGVLGAVGKLFGGKEEPVVEEPVVAAADNNEPAAMDGIYGEGDELAELSEDAAATTAAESKAMKLKAAAEAAKAKKPTPVLEEPAFVEAEPSLSKKNADALAALEGTAAVEEQATKKPIAASLAQVPVSSLKPTPLPIEVPLNGFKKKAASDVSPEEPSWVTALYDAAEKGLERKNNEHGIDRRAKVGFPDEAVKLKNGISTEVPPSSEKAVRGNKLALVVGIDRYDNVPKLEKAVNDSNAISKALTNIGYETVVVENPDRKTLNAKLSEFQTRIAPGDSAVFYFAGHGVALGSDNVLLAKDVPSTEASNEDQIRSEGFIVDEITRRIQKQGAKTTLLILDACRDNPFIHTATRSIGNTRGLTTEEAPSGVFVLYSAGIGQTALDRLSDTDGNPNSVFTRMLLPALSSKGLALTSLAKKVQKQVADLAATVNHQQQPAYYDQIIGEVSLNESQ